MALTFTPNNPIVPIRMGIKHDPPTLALVYKRKQQDIKERIYSILLNSLVELNDPKIIALKLFEEHALILNENIIDMDQVEKLVTILQQKYEEKKSHTGFSNPNTQDFISPIHTYETQNKDPYNIQDNEPDIHLDDTTSHQKNGKNQPKFNNNDDSIQGDSHFYEQENQNYQTPNPNQKGINSSPPQDQYNSEQLSEEAELYSSGYNPSFSTRNGSASELKKQKIKSKNEKNKSNLTSTHKNLNELISGNQESSMQQYMNSHYNYGQRKNNAENDYLDENNINYEQNEFIEEENIDQNNEQNEDYHNLMNEEQNYPYSKNKNNKQKNNQNQQYLNDNFAFQKTPMKSYIDSQIDYQSNFNSFEDSYGVGSHNNYSNHNISNKYNNQITNNQGINAPFFSKRQTAPSTGYSNEEEQQPSQQQDNKKRRNKFGQLRDLANQNRENDDNMNEDQLEII